ncbi:MAG: ATP-binding cassette domain-containing protein [Solirubrobacteraceae bacterium]
MGADALTAPAVRVRGVSKTFAVRRQTLPAPIPWFGSSKRAPDANGVRGIVVDPEDDEDEEGLDDDESSFAPTSGPTLALDDVSFEASAGEGLAILGADGSGKSTLLRILARITFPSDGIVEIRGRVAPLFAMASSLMKLDRTGAENVRHLARFHGLPLDLVEERMARIFTWADLAGLEHQPVKMYSSGMYQRLAFSIMVNLGPDVILADAMVGVGDRPFRRRCGVRLQECVDEGAALILATQDTAIARRFCSRAVWLKEGRVIAAGPVETVADLYEEAQGAGSRPAPTGETQLVDLGVFSSGGTPVEIARSSESMTLRAFIEVVEAGVLFETSFVLFDGRTKARLTQPTQEHANEAGRYSVEVRLPAGALPEGRYSLRVAARLDKRKASSTIKQRGQRAFEILEEDDAGLAEPAALRELEGSTDLRWSVARVVTG